MNGMAICAGVEGIELGLRLVEPEYRTVCYVEGELYTAAILRTRMEEALLDEAPIWDDVKTFNGKSWRGKVDIITAGFPCQPWSVAGKQEGTKDERWIWPDIARIIGEVRPGYVFLENVPGLLNKGGGHIVLGDLTKAGYNIEWMSLSAADVGANHKRERVWILAYTISTATRMEAHRSSGQRRETATTSESKILSQENREGCAERIGASCEDVEISSVCGQCQPGNVCEQQGGAKSCRTSETLSKGNNPTDKSSEARCEEMANSKSIRYGRGKNRDRGNKRSVQKQEKEVKPILRSEAEGCSRIEGWWTVEPDVGRVAHGVPFRVDRLRACGNGVVPLVAATAFRELKRRALK